VARLEERRRLRIGMRPNAGPGRFGEARWDVGLTQAILMTKRALLLFSTALALGACRSAPASESAAAGESTAAVGDSIAEAVGAAERWLRMIDSGDYAGSWDAAAELVQSAVSQEQWIQAIAAARSAHGATTSRRLRTASFTRSLPNAPEGAYVVIVYETSFANGSGIETVTPMRDPDGEWRVSGYFIR
jgi:hypothetical protein